MGKSPTDWLKDASFESNWGSVKPNGLIVKVPNSGTHKEFRFTNKAQSDLVTSLLDTIWRLDPITGKTSDGYHTFDELYEFRLMYNAAFFNLLARSDYIEKKYRANADYPNFDVHKSYRHSDGELCFGKDNYFVVVAQLPTGQITNHYKGEYWDLFKIPARERAAEWDGHTPQESLERMREYLISMSQEVEI